VSPQLDAFASEARRFVAWARGEDADAMTAAAALRRVVALYGEALRLPNTVEVPPSLDEVAQVSEDEWRLVFDHAQTLPLRHYGEVFDPLELPPEDPVVGDVADDIADIYRDIASGLRLFDSGRSSDALWEWGYNFRVHWGKHAGGAIRALHAYLALHDADAPSE
jgi:hypothetical protein